MNILKAVVRWFSRPKPRRESGFIVHGPYDWGEKGSIEFKGAYVHPAITGAVILWDGAGTDNKATINPSTTASVRGSGNARMGP